MWWWVSGGADGVCGGARGELWWFQGTLGVLMGSAVMPAPRGRAELSGKPTLLLRGHSCTAGPVKCSKSRGHHRVTPTPLLGAMCPSLLFGRALWSQDTGAAKTTLGCPISASTCKDG